MNNLGQAFRRSLRYKYSIIGSIICSAIVAVFWGVNITAVYPFVEVVFQNKTLHDWVDDKIAEQAVQAQQAAAVGQAAALDHLSSAERLKPWIDRYAPTDAFATLIAIVAFLLIGTALKSLFRVTSLVLISNAAGRTTVDLRNDFFRALLSEQPRASSHAGDAAARIGGDMGAIGSAVQTLFGRSVQEPLKMVVCLVGAAALNWRLLLFSLLVCPLASVLLIGLARSIRRASLRAFDQKCLLMGRMLQTFQGLSVVKAYNMESHERRRFWTHTHAVFREQLKITWYEGLIRSNNELLGIGVVCLSALAGGFLVLEQQTTILGIKLASHVPDMGEIFLFFGLLIGCTDPLRKMSDVYGSLQKGAAAADRIMPFVEGMELRPPKPERRIRTLQQPLIFRNVKFYYVKPKYVLRGVTFRISPGETLAVVGPNGCGKSTLVNLLLRFQEPTQGKIFLGDTDLSTVRRKNLRRCVSLVTQKAVLFNDTVFNNIAYGTRRATKEQVIRAATKAHAHEFIVNELPNGYDSPCGDGGNRLSGGQQQRIALARAILRDPDLLILDEASSQIDPKSEQLIRQSLAEFTKDRTTFMITHQMSTLELADRILVMDAGRIIDIGRHHQLMQRCAIYRSLHETSARRSA